MRAMSVQISTLDRRLGISEGRIETVEREMKKIQQQLDEVIACSRAMLTLTSGVEDFRCPGKLPVRGAIVFANNTAMWNMLKAYKGHKLKLTKGADGRSWP